MNDDFEQQLQRQSPRPLPSDWRADILRPAHAAATPRSSHPSSILHSLSSLLWPHPRAWAALATVWIVIFVLNFSARDESPQVAQKPAPPSPEMLMALRQQKLMLAELIGTPEAPAAEEARRYFGPRSERATETLNA
jgi:hypothetical protein